MRDRVGRLLAGLEDHEARRKCNPQRLQVLLLFLFLRASKAPLLYLCWTAWPPDHAGNPLILLCLDNMYFAPVSFEKL